MASYEGVKIQLRIHDAKGALGDWFPLRNRKQTDSINYLLREAMCALRLFGVASKKPKEPSNTNIKTSPTFDPLLARQRLLQSLADGHLHTSAQTKIDTWTNDSGAQERTYNRLHITLPRPGEEADLFIANVSFLSKGLVGHTGVAVALRPRSQLKEPPPLPQDFSSLPTPLSPATKRLLEAVCTHLGQAPLVDATPLRLRQLVEGTLQARCSLQADGYQCLLSPKLMTKLGVVIHNKRPVDVSQRFLWHLLVEQKVLKAARVEAPTMWATVNTSTPKRARDMQEMCDKWAAFQRSEK